MQVISRKQKHYTSIYTGVYSLTGYGYLRGWRHKYLSAKTTTG